MPAFRNGQQTFVNLVGLCLDVQACVILLYTSCPILPEKLFVQKGHEWPVALILLLLCKLKHTVHMR